MTVSKEMSAARKLGTLSAHPDAEGEGHEKKGQQGEGSGRGIGARQKAAAGRCATEPATLATEATTPSLTSKVMMISVSVTTSLYLRLEGLLGIRDQGSGRAATYRWHAVEWSYGI